MVMERVGAENPGALVFCQGFPLEFKFFCYRDDNLMILSIELKDI